MVLFQILLVLFSFHPIDAMRCSFSDVSLRIYMHLLVENPKQVAEPVPLLPFGFVRYSLQ
jgi:hypothetical protein